MVSNFDLFSCDSISSTDPFLDKPLGHQTYVVFTVKKCLSIFLVALKYLVGGLKHIVGVSNLFWLGGHVDFGKRVKNS